jgi:O-antigen/teichoic acid export membrane protein
LYVGSQAIFPGIRKAVKERDANSLQSQSRRYFILASVWCFLIAGIVVMAWHFYSPQEQSLMVATALLLPALFLAAPFAFMVSLYYSLQLEEAYARFALFFMLIRCSLAPILAWFWGYVGLCAIHLIVGTIAVIVLWLACRTQVHLLFAAGNDDG